MTWLSSLLRSVNRNPMRGPRPGRMSARKRCAFQLRLERLEDRLVPTTGTSAGTVLVKDINSGSASSNPAFLTDLNGALLFGAGGGLWRSDSTGAGTVLLQDFGGSNPSDLTNVNGTLFFGLRGDPTHGTELWKSDGTAAGTVLVADVSPPGYNLYLDHLTNVNDTLFFVANDGINGEELWKSDGTAAGTVLVKDINLGNDSNGYPKSSFAYQLTNMNGTLFLVANDGTHGWELWRSDGTETGTI